MKLDTYLNYGGNCAEALTFYAQHLGGTITMMMKHGDQPGGNPPPPGLAGKLLHARMNLAGMTVLAADVQPERFQPMRSAYLSLTVDSIDEAERIYTLLTEGGEIFMKIGETFFAYRFAMFRDKFGTSWMLMNPKP